MRKDLLERLNSGEILICDGSVGITLQALGCPPGESVEKWGLEHDDILRNLHVSYIEAGADIIITNTLGGNRLMLEKYGLGDQVEYLNKGLANIALDASSRFSKPVYVAGNVSATGEQLEPYGDLTESEAIEVFSQQVKALVDGGVDFIFIETIIDVNEAVSAVKASKLSCDLPVFASLSFDFGNRGFRTVYGNSPEQVVDLLQEAGADVVGSNCGSVLASKMPELIKQMKSAGARLVVVEPNAGLPELINGRNVFHQTPQEMAIHVLAMIDAGANVIGGCCGTTPEHIRLIAKAVKEYMSNV